MGVATARALLDPGGGLSLRVLLVDRDGQRLREAADALADHPGRWETRVGDVRDEDTPAELASCVAVAGALSWRDSRPLLDLCARYPIRLATIGRPPVGHLAELPERLASGARMVIGSGLEPGLTEILARRLIDRVGPDATLRLYCGGVPAHPRPPLRHLSWYGSQLTISPRPAFRIRAGTLEPVARFSGLELVGLPGLGTLEAYHDGLAPWIADDPAFATVRTMEQKTLRWPGYARRVRLLSELGLLAPEPVYTADGPVRPRVLLDALLAPHITPRRGDTDITLLVAEVTGAPTNGHSGHTTTTLVRADTDLASGTAGMGRLTGGVLAATIRLLADGPAQGPGIGYPHQIFCGPEAEKLLTGLRHSGVSVVDHPGTWLRVADPAHDPFQQRDE